MTALSNIMLRCNGKAKEVRQDNAPVNVDPRTPGPGTWRGIRFICFANDLIHQ